MLYPRKILEGDFMSQVVAFCGVKGSGKDFQASKLQAQGHVWIDFKHELQDMVSDIIGYDCRESYEWFKEFPVGMRRPENELMANFVVQDARELMRKYPEIMTGRRLLQRVGTEAIRKRHPNYWAEAWYNRAMKAIRDGMSVTVADCRFENEVRFIRKTSIETKFIFCDYRSYRYDAADKHESEVMAQALLRAGLSDGQEISHQHFTDALCPF